MNSIKFRVLRADEALVRSTKFDIGFFSVGFETRCTHIFRIIHKMISKSIAIGFDYGQNPNFQESRTSFIDGGAEYIESPDIQTHALFKESINVAARDKGVGDRIKVLFDVTSFNRSRIASFIQVISEFSDSLKIDVLFSYSFASYVPYVLNEKPIASSEMISEFFSGWSSTPELPLSLILGLGYESDRAIGVVEYLEPWKVIAMRPIGGEDGFDRDVLTANVLLWDQVKDAHFTYPVNDPYTLFQLLDSVVRGCLSNSRVVILPQGPKLFTLASLLVAALRIPNVGIWRTSHRSDEAIVDRRASGKLAFLHVSVSG